MENKLSSIEQAKLSRVLGVNDQRIKRLEAFLTGQPLGTVRFADVSITNSKISSLSANKITSGSIGVGQEISVLGSDGNKMISMTDDHFAIAKQGFDVDTTDMKNKIIDSDIPCLKFIQSGKRDFTINSSTTTVYEETITTSFPIMPLVFVYQPVLGLYKVVPQYQWQNYFDEYFHAEMSFDATKLYVTVSNYTGAQRTSHYYWFIPYA